MPAAGGRPVPGLGVPGSCPVRARRSVPVLRVRSCLVAELSTLLDELLYLAVPLLRRGGVAWLESQLFLRRDSRPQQAGALHLGVDLGPEQERKVGDPQPEKEDDDARQRAVGLVVAAEMGD